MSEVDLAWLAGIIDGEGTVRIYRCHDKRRRDGLYCIKPDLRIANTNSEIIAAATSIMRSLVHDQWAVRVYVYQPSHRGTKIYYHIQVGRRDEIAKILAAIIPHLRGKKAQAEIVWQWCQQRLAKQPIKGGFMQPQDDQDTQLLVDLRRSLGDNQRS